MCDNLTSIVIPGSVKTIKHDAFYYCENLEDVTIENGVKNIEATAFTGCTALTSVKIPDSVASIGEDAFKRVQHIYIKLPATGEPWGANEIIWGTEKIQENPGQEELFNAEEWDKKAAPEDVFIWASDDPTSPDYGKIVGYKANVDNYPVLRYPSRCTSVGVDTSYITGTSEEVETIRSYTKNIKKVELPETVTEIGDNAYNKHSFDSMKEINIPNGVKSIGGFAFHGCTSLNSITIPNSVTSIGSDAFSGCTGLSSITIPDSVTSIGFSAFREISTVYYCARNLVGAPWGALAIN